MEINSTRTSQINFCKRLLDTDYSRMYRDKKAINGNEPDEYILSRLSQISKGESKNVFDFGAGQGRNTIPVAQKGHTVHAIEISYDGLFDITSNAHNKFVGNKVKTIHQNLLDTFKFETKADFAYMAHISQHFDKDELEQVLRNASKILKKDSEFVFDALVRTRKNYKKYDKLPHFFTTEYGLRDPEDYGSASFKREDILAAAKRAGLKLVAEAKFSEKGKNRAMYEKQNLWGGFDICEFLVGITRRPVKLTWFVLRK